MVGDTKRLSLSNLLVKSEVKLNRKGFTLSCECKVNLLMIIFYQLIFISI